MPSIRPTPEVKQDIVVLINGLLDYNTSINLSNQIQIDTKWDKKNLKIGGTIEQLVKFLPQETPPSNPAEQQKYLNRQKEHLRYLLLKILQDKLGILIDDRPTNSQGKRQGVRIWKFTIQLWYPPTQTDYISLNLRALERHWNKIYNITPTTTPTYHNLPQRRHTKFIGHRAELQELLSLLAGTRQQIISIVGMPGVGKTTLAVEAAYRCLKDFKFETIIFSSAQSQQLVGSHLTRNFAERNLRDLLQVIFRTLDCLDVIPFGIEEQIRYLGEILAARPTLIVIDNIETANDQEETIGFILNLPPSVKVIVTSRVRLGIGQVIDLYPLKANESAFLTQHQAKTQNLDIEAVYLAPIHKRTGGLPIAIAYLIGKIATDGFSILERLPQLPLATDEIARYCFTPSVEGLRAIPDRVAYQILLSLSLFTDAATTAAITYIVNSDSGLEHPPTAIASGLQQLYQRCLVDPLAPERYSLHSLTQEYVRLELAKQPDYAAQIRDRWQNWYLDLVAPYGAVYWHEWQDYSPLTADWRNLRSVVDWCIQERLYDDVLYFWQCLRGFTHFGGYWLEREQWLEWLQEMAEERQDFVTIAELQYHHSYTLCSIDEYDNDSKAMQLAQEAWEYHQHLDIDLQCEMAFYRAMLYIRGLSQEDNRSANLESAQTWLDRGLNILDKIETDSLSHHRHHFQYYYYQAEIQASLEEFDLAEENYLQAERLAHKSGCQRFIQYSNGRIAIVLAKKGQLIEAEDRFREVLAHTQRYQDSRAGTFCQKNLAELYLAKGDPDRAREYAQQAKTGFQRLRMAREATAMEQFLAALPDRDC